MTQSRQPIAFALITLVLPGPDREADAGAVPLSASRTGTRTRPSRVRDDVGGLGGREDVPDRPRTDRGGELLWHCTCPDAVYHGETERPPLQARPQVDSATVRDRVRSASSSAEPYPGSRPRAAHAVRETGPAAPRPSVPAPCSARHASTAAWAAESVVMHVTRCATAAAADLPLVGANCPGRSAC